MIGIDSMILVYAGIVHRKTSGRSKERDDLAVRAKLLLHMKRNDPIILPAVAISEILVPVPANQQGLLIAKLSERFICQSFDLPAAAIAAGLWSRYKELPGDLQYKTRQVLRADAMIVASARAAGATEFYTNDRQCRARAGLIMEGRELPTRDPDDMFLEPDIRRGKA